ncbi:hypothetical protein DFP86_11221 [Paludibacterium purpuratum]|uniref:Methyltransferase family protein n=1 Tax=Paludibacterium purpuratum TaxID=1144873 RepID=A0A4R7B1K2_9NEIS|nr:hypothetical protein DFP86_11221 [Paludibacterium purpuratum]
MLAWYFVAPAAHPARWAIGAGLVAVVLALVWQSRGAKAWLHGLPIPAALLAWWAGIPPWLFLAAFLATLAFGRNAWQAQVPLYRSSREAAQALADALAPGTRLLEAGAGDGRLALWLARLRPDLQLTALENAWGSYWLACLRWRLAGRPENVRLGSDDFWGRDWGEYDAIYVFLSPAPMKRVWDKFQSQAKPGAVLISNTFAIPDVQPARCLPLSGRLQQSLLFWRAEHGAE